MNVEVYKITEEMKSKMGGFFCLLVYRYGNLCIKADPMALLPIEADFDGVSCKLEDVTDVLMEDEYTFRLIPKSPDAIPAILKGVKLEHPEFRIETRPMEGSENPAEMEILFHMPEVDDDRKKLLTDTVKTLGDDCKLHLEACFNTASARIAVNMVGDSEEDIKAKKEELQKIYDWHKEKWEKTVADKNSEIEEAWKAWKEKAGARNAAKQDDDLSKGADTLFKMKLD